ncbi:MAG: hypothetical protein F4X87_05390 [Chloroflexi bacterium]|nr:hypothetical protein [Chloroflexota bacterium]
MAEELLGPKGKGFNGTAFEICRPSFHNSSIPEMKFTVSHDDALAVHAVLGCDAESDWTYVVYQLAHETIHMLNPVTCSEVNYLEEGVAVAFSIYAQKKFGVSAQEPNPDNEADRKYACAYSLVKQLPDGALESARRIRQKVGRLSDATADDLKDLYPDLDPSIAEKLASKFNA